MKDVYYVDFDVDEVTSKINGFMSRWFVHLIHIKGQEWKIYDHSDILVYEFDFLIDFKDIEAESSWRI